MPLVPAKCPECGGNVNIDPEKKAAVCEFCKQPFVVEEAINSFSTTYNITNHNDIKADVVNVYESKETDFIIKAGVLEKYTGESVNVVIPNTVKVIGENAFKQARIETVMIPEGIEKIEKAAFFGCEKLIEITIPDTVVEISEDSYHGEDGWKSRIGSFQNCISLQIVNLSKQLKSTGINTFKNCSNIKTLTLPQGLEVIGVGTFDGCINLKAITLPNSLHIIADRAFRRCESIEEIEIPNSVNLIGNSAFEDCKNLKVSRFPSKCKENTIMKSTYKNCASIERIEVPYGVIAIGDMDNDTSWQAECKRSSPFAGCVNLDTVVLPDGLKKIGEGVFSDCVNLREINIPDSVEKTSDSAFYNCSKLNKMIVSDAALKRHWRDFYALPIFDEYMKQMQQTKTCPICGMKLSAFGKCKTNHCPNINKKVFDKEGKYLGGFGYARK